MGVRVETDYSQIGDHIGKVIATEVPKKERLARRKTERDAYVSLATELIDTYGEIPEDKKDLKETPPATYKVTPTVTVNANGAEVALQITQRTQDHNYPYKRRRYLRTAILASVIGDKLSYQLFQTNQVITYGTYPEDRIEGTETYVTGVNNRRATDDDHTNALLTVQYIADRLRGDS